MSTRADVDAAARMAAENRAAADERERLLREAAQWRAKEKAEAELTAAAQRRSHSDAATLEATRKRIEAEANLRKQAMIRADADAAAERLAHEKLDVGRKAIEQHRLLEEAENEAANVARIRANTERTLAAQAQACAEADRARERAALARVQAENEAAREARRHAEAEAAARAQAAATLAAERAAEAAAAGRLAAVRQRDEERWAKQQAAQDTARARRSRWALALAAIRYASPLRAAALALLVGVGSGVWFAWSAHPGSGQDEMLAGDAPVDVHLRLERSLR